LSAGGPPEGEGGCDEERPPPSAPRMQDISITLSIPQVGHVLREATGTGGLRNMLMGQVDDLRVAIAAVLEDPQLKSHQISYSTLKALDVWCAFAPPGTIRGIHEIARELRLSASTTHRYVQTLLEIGLIERDPQTRKYRIAPQTNVGAPESDATG
jgi:IclR helix-turn-helix domain